MCWEKLTSSILEPAHKPKLLICHVCSMQMFVSLLQVAICNPSSTWRWKYDFQRPRTAAGAHLWPWPRCYKVIFNYWIFLAFLFISSFFCQVHVCNVVVLDNPSHFKNPFQFEITFECIEVNSFSLHWSLLLAYQLQTSYLHMIQDLPEDLEWKIIYVGSAESEEYDQVIVTFEREITCWWYCEFRLLTPCTWVPSLRVATCSSFRQKNPP